MLNVNLPEFVLKAVSVLENGGYKANLVGGCVRDWAMGIPPHDYDIATNALPTDIISLFDGFRVIETGVKHGTVTVIIDSEPIEITTYRIDGEYEDNRRPKNVNFTDNLSLDLSRRDFTINAMAYSPADGLTDIFSGEKHLRDKKIVCVGDPYKRFEEDGLRILRALRFASVLSFEIEKNTAAAIFDKMNLLSFISKERIFSEIKKMFCGVGCAKVMKEFSKVIAACAPPVSEESILIAADKINLVQNVPHARLAYLFLIGSRNYGEDGANFAREAMKGLKASKAEINKVSNLVSACLSGLPTEIFEVKRFAAKIDESDVPAAISIRTALGEKNAEIFADKYKTVIDSRACIRISELDVRGGELVEKFGLAGADVGNMLNRLLELVIEEKIENVREDLINAAEKIISVDYNS